MSVSQRVIAVFLMSGSWEGLKGQCWDDWWQCGGFVGASNPVSKSLALQASPGKHG